MEKEQGKLIIIVSVVFAMVLLCMICTSDSVPEVKSLQECTPDAVSVLDDGRKLLMEFDQEGLAREGVDTAVTVEMCQIPERGQIVGTWKDYIRAGEELLWIQRKGRDQEDSFCLR